MKASFDSHSFSFSPQSIEFSQEAKPQFESTVPDDPVYLSLKASLANLPPDSSWRADLELHLNHLLSQSRCQVITQVLSRLNSECLANASQLKPQQIKELLATLRKNIQQNYLPCLQKGSPIYLYSVELLNLMDAVGLGNRLILNKALGSVDSLESDLIDSDLGWAEFQGALELKQVLMTIAQQQDSSYKRVKVQPIVQEMLEYPEFVWQAELACYYSAESIPLAWYPQSYQSCLKQGFRFLQKTIQQGFQNKNPLALALGSFFLALRLDPERSEAPFILACLATLLKQPTQAADFLEYALKQGSQPEMRDLLQLMQVQALQRQS